MLADPTSTALWSTVPTKVCHILSSPARCRMIVELSKYEWVPASHLSRAGKVSASSGSQHLALLRKLKIAESGFGRLYRLNPALRPPEGVDFIDFGHLRLPINAWK